jgi:prefoldin subunit 5
MDDKTVENLRAVRKQISLQIEALNGIGQDVECDDGINDAINYLDDALKAIEGALSGTENL